MANKVPSQAITPTIPPPSRPLTPGNVASPLAFATPLLLVVSVLVLGSLPVLYLILVARPPAPVLPPPPVVQVPNEALDPLQKQLAAVRADIRAAVKAELANLPAAEKPIDSRAELKAIQTTLAESKLAWEAWQKEWKARDTKPTPSPTPTPTPPTRPIVAEDVVIAVLHSGRVSYPRDLKEPLRTLFRERLAPAEQRLALAIVVGDSLDKPLVDWKDKPREWKPERFDNELPDDNQLHEGLTNAVINRLIKLFQDAPEKKGRPRLVVIASSRCRAPDYKSDAWKKLVEQKVRLDVLLVREADAVVGGVNDGNRWLEACGQTRGMVSFVQRGDKPAQMHQEVLAHLREWTRPSEK
jgi:hypothetical protein